MPRNDQPKNRLDQPDVPDGQDRPRVSRRSVLGAAGVGAAGRAAGAFGGLATASAATASKPAAKPAASENRENEDRQGHDEPVVVHVHAGRDGELDVYHGTTETHVRDPELAARLRRATQ
jgi:nitrous oxide reductase